MAKIYTPKVKKSFKINLTHILLAGLLLRLILIYFQYSGDVLNHLAWGRGALEDIPGFYNKTFPGFNHPNYPPVTILLFSFSVWLYQLLQNLIIFLNQSIKIFPSTLVPLMETLNMQAAFLKLPAILADIGIGWLIYRLSSKLLPVAFYLLNPAVIYISTVWGQIESIPIFFILLSLYFFNKRQFVTLSGPQRSVGWLRTFSGLQLKNYYLSHISFVLAILSKQTALWLLPVFLVLWFKGRPLKTFLQGLTLQVVIFTLLYIPFTLSLVEPFRLYLATLSGSSSLVSDAAWNIWHFLYPINTSDSILVYNVYNFSLFTPRSLSLLSLTISTAAIIFKFYTNKINLYQALFWLSMAAFFLQTRVHERHLFPALVFFILAFKPSTSEVAGFLSLTFYHLFNLYWSLGLPFI